MNYNYRDSFHLPSGGTILIRDLLWLPNTIVWEEGFDGFLKNCTLDVEKLALSRTCYNSYRTLKSQKESKYLPHVVYVLECQIPNHFYVGETSNFPQRLNSHREGRGSRFTQRYGVKSVLQTVNTSDRKSALLIQKQLSYEYKRKYGYDNVFSY